MRVEFVAVETVTVGVRIVYERQPYVRVYILVTRIAVEKTRLAVRKYRGTGSGIKGVACYRTVEIIPVISRKISGPPVVGGVTSDALICGGRIAGAEIYTLPFFEIRIGGEFDQMHRIVDIAFSGRWAHHS